MIIALFELPLRAWYSRFEVARILAFGRAVQCLSARLSTRSRQRDEYGEAIIPLREKASAF